jgi:RNA polymerase sigma-70 factor (ECF subfamily)
MSQTEDTSDISLVIAIGRYNQDALAEVYRRHSSSVISLARRITGLNDMAQDVAQEVFLDLWKRPEKFDPDRGSLRTYLMTKAHSKCVDLLRSETSRKKREMKYEEPALKYRPENEAWDVIMKENVKNAMTALSESERVAVEMAYFAGYTYRDVARILNIPEGTIKSRIKSGLSKLKEFLGENKGVTKSSLSEGEFNYD